MLVDLFYTVMVLFFLCCTAVLGIALSDKDFRRVITGRGKVFSDQGGLPPPKPWTGPPADSVRRITEHDPVPQEEA